MTLADILTVYNGSSGDATKALFARLAGFEPRGTIAINLMRTCKASERAKKYRGGGYRAMAYDKKDWAISELCRAMVLTPDVIPSWGWGFDVKAIGFEHVLYVDIPGTGQVSFHTSYRKDGPSYSGQWDGVHGVAPHRICRWVEAVLDGREASNEGEKDVVHTGTEGAGIEGNAREQGGVEEKQEAFNLGRPE